MADQQQPAAEKEASPRQPAAAATSLLASFRANTAHDRGDNNVSIAEASGLPADPLSAADSAVASDAGAPAPHAGSPPLAPASFQPPPPPPPSPAAHAASPVAAGAAAAAAAIVEEEAANLAAINAVRGKMLKQLKENRLEYVAALGRRDEGKATAPDHAIIASTAKMETSLAANKAVVDANAAINAAGGAAASHAAAAAAKAKSLVQAASMELPYNGFGLPHPRGAVPTISPISAEHAATISRPTAAEVEKRQDAARAAQTVLAQMKERRSDDYKRAAEMKLPVSLISREQAQQWQARTNRLPTPSHGYMITAHDERAEIFMRRYLELLANKTTAQWRNEFRHLIPRAKRTANQTLDEVAEIYLSGLGFHISREEARYNELCVEAKTDKHLPLYQRVCEWIMSECARKVSVDSPQASKSQRSADSCSVNDQRDTAQFKQRCAAATAAVKTGAATADDHAVIRQMNEFSNTAAKSTPLTTAEERKRTEDAIAAVKARRGTALQKEIVLQALLEEQVALKKRYETAQVAVMAGTATEADHATLKQYDALSYTIANSRAEAATYAQQQTAAAVTAFEAGTATDFQKQLAQQYRIEQQAAQHKSKTNSTSSTNTKTHQTRPRENNDNMDSDDEHDRAAAAQTRKRQETREEYLAALARRENGTATAADLALIDRVVGDTTHDHADNRMSMDDNNFNTNQQNKPNQPKPIPAPSLGRSTGGGSTGAATTTTGAVSTTQQQIWYDSRGDWIVGNGPYPNEGYIYSHPPPGMLPGSQRTRRNGDDDASASNTNASRHVDTGTDGHTRVEYDDDEREAPRSPRHPNDRQSDTTRRRNKRRSRRDSRDSDEEQGAASRYSSPAEHSKLHPRPARNHRPAASTVGRGGMCILSLADARQQWLERNNKHPDDAVPPYETCAGCKGMISSHARGAVNRERENNNRAQVVDVVDTNDNSRHAQRKRAKLNFTTSNHDLTIQQLRAAILPPSTENLPHHQVGIFQRCY